VAELITSRDNEKLKLVRKLRDRRWRDKLGLLVVEGEDLLAAAATAGIEPVELLVAAGSDVPRAAAARPGLPASGGRGENVAPSLLAEVSTLAHPARAIGVFRRDDLPHGTRPVTLALWRVADPGNVGTLIRSAGAFGAGVALSAGCADPTSSKALRASMGAIFRVPLVAFDEPPRPPEAAAASGRAPVAWLPALSGGGQRVALVPRGGTPLPDVVLENEVVLVLGAEREGLPGDVVERCDARASIPQPGGGGSLNVAMAGTVALYELARRAASV
jgi:TrmH family RNA methyltransferase